MMTATPPPVQDWITSLRASHDRFRALVTPLDEAALGAPSYDPGWSVAQVTSHLGSAAQIFALYLEAGVAGTAVPGMETVEPIWDTWNARSATEQRDHAVPADEALVQRLEGTGQDVRDGLKMELFGMAIDLAGFVRMRLAEHALHTWDIAVALDPTATVAADAVALLVPGLAQIAAWAGKPSPEPFTVLVRLTDRDGAYLVTAGEHPSIEPAGADTAADGTVSLPAEAYLRLVYGRLDPDHSPTVTESGTRGLADLRQVFQGL